MRFFAFGMIEFTVRYARSCAHALHVARWNTFDVAHAIFVRQFAGQHIANDFHIAVAVGTKAHSGCNAVFVDNSQITPTHVLWIVITREGKGMEAF